MTFDHIPPQPVPLGELQKTVAETSEYSLSIEFIPDGTKCFLNCKLRVSRVDLEPAQVLSLLDSIGIVREFIESDKLDQFCLSLAKGANPGRVQVAAGMLPTRGTDGWVEITVSTSEDASNYVIDERGRIDFRSRRSFTNVIPGQSVGTIHPPGIGKAGMTVTGQEIPPLLGHRFKFRAGPGVRIDEGNMRIMVEAAGRLLFDGTTLSVTDEFVVSRDVNYGVGHIEFAGFVHVRGDVLDGFNIKATKGIQVDGVVGSCKLVAGGDITLNSMFGKGVGIIKSTGNLTVKILSGVNVECQGNVAIGKEVRDSLIKSLGTVTADTICGGEYMARMGLAAKTIGAKCGKPSRISTGTSFFSEERLHELQREFRSVTAAVQRTKESIEALSRQMEKTTVESVGIRLKTQKRELEELFMAHEILEEELRLYQLETELPANPKINILSMLHEGVIIDFGEMEKKIVDDIAGPTSIIKYSSGEGFRKMPLSPLKVLVETMMAKPENR